MVYLDYGLESANISKKHISLSILVYGLLPESPIIAIIHLCRRGFALALISNRLPTSFTQFTHV